MKRVPKKKIWDSIEEDGNHVISLYDTDSKTLKPKAQLFIKCAEDVLLESLNKISLVAQKIDVNAKIKTIVIITEGSKNG